MCTSIRVEIAASFATTVSRESSVDWFLFQLSTNGIACFIFSVKELAKRGNSHSLVKKLFIG